MTMFSPTSWLILVSKQSGNAKCMKIIFIYKLTQSKEKLVLTESRLYSRQQRYARAIDRSLPTQSYHKTTNILSQIHITWVGGKSQNRTPLYWLVVDRYHIHTVTEIVNQCFLSKSHDANAGRIWKARSYQKHVMTETDLTSTWSM